MVASAGAATDHQQANRNTAGAMKRFVKDHDDAQVPVRKGLRWNAAFIIGVSGAMAIIAGSTLPQLTIPENTSAPLRNFKALLALQFGADAMISILALLAIAFRLFGRYRWIIQYALMVVIFLAAVRPHQLTDLVDVESNEAIDTEELLNDLVQVVYEIIEGAPGEGGAGEDSAPATT